MLTLFCIIKYLSSVGKIKGLEDTKKRLSVEHSSVNNSDNEIGLSLNAV